MTLRSQIIRLAYEKPELRSALLPILKEASPQWTYGRSRAGESEFRLKIGDFLLVTVFEEDGRAQWKIKDASGGYLHLKDTKRRGVDNEDFYEAMRDAMKAIRERGESNGDAHVIRILDAIRIKPVNLQLRKPT